MNENNHFEKKRLENPPATFRLKIQRREKEGSTAYWETFKLPYGRNLNVIPVLMEIRKTLSQSRASRPRRCGTMSYLEQVCGICKMAIERVRQSCSALIDDRCSLRAEIRNAGADVQISQCPRS